MARSGSGGQWRFRLYFILMDVLTIITLIGLYQAVVEGVSAEPNLLHLVVGFVGLLLPALMLAGFMRDEFAEQCWQKAAATTVKVLFVLPIGLLILLAILRQTGVADFGVGNAIRSANGAEAFTLFMTVLAACFAFAFQVHRWRGSR